jgi:hypothetical protein
MNRILPASLAALLVCAIAAPALAQPAPKTQAEADAMAEAQENAKRAEAAKEEKAKAPPPAIPGAEAGGVVAPADKLATDMAPNDALFDAINRGDAAAARDALSRGAQIDAKNILGQTPIDASIDSNRTDITFLLLSMRGAAPTATRPGKTEGSLAAYHPAPKHAGKPARTIAATASSSRTASAQNPGTPNPAVGFTGF